MYCCALFWAESEKIASRQFFYLTGLQNNSYQADPESLSRNRFCFKAVPQAKYSHKIHS